MARDAQWIFGLISMATKDVQVYSADSVQLGAINSKSPFSLHQTGKVDGYEAVFSVNAALAAIDSFIPILQDSADGSSWTALLTGAQTAGALPKGTKVRLPVPITHRAYLRASAMPKSTGVFTAGALTAWIEPGPN